MIQQYLVEFVLNKVEFKRKQSIMNKVFVVLLSGQMQSKTQHTPPIRNNFASFYNQILKCQYAHQVVLVVYQLNVKNEEIELGRMVVPLKELIAETKFNIRFYHKISQDQIYVHFDVKILNRSMFYSQSESHLSELSMEAPIHLHTSTISEHTNPNQMFLKSEHKAKSDLNRTPTSMANQFQEEEKKNQIQITHFEPTHNEESKRLTRDKQRVNDILNLHVQLNIWQARQQANKLEQPSNTSNSIAQYANYMLAGSFLLGMVVAYI